MAGNPESPFPFDVTKQFSAEPDRVHRYLERYFREDAPASERFTGRWFETLIGTSDPDRFTATDLVAVSTLSVTIPPEAVALILLDRETAAEINELLHRSPKAGTDLATVHPEDLAAGAPLHALPVWGRLSRPSLRGAPARRSWSRWSARSEARTNDLDQPEGRCRLGMGRCTRRGGALR
jgi:hypothetical protein